MVILVESDTPRIAAVIDDLLTDIENLQSRVVTLNDVEAEFASALSRIATS